MKLSTKQGLRAGISFGIFMGIYNGVVHEPIQGVFAAVFGGLAFGAAMAFVLRRKERVWAAIRQPYEAEGIVHHGPASCSLGEGYLMLTQKRLVWIPTKEKARSKLISIAREAIANAEKTSKLSPQIRVSATTGESALFLVGSERDAWLGALHDTRAPLPEARVVT
jgi:hypothetical protein